MTTSGSKYKAALLEGSRVQLIHEGHPQHTGTGNLVGILPNPSKLARNQWYDVRFDNGVYGRFQGRYLETIAENGAVAVRAPAA
jgi:hypothetical protein